MSFRKTYLRFKSHLPESLRDVLSSVNQHLFARSTLRRKYGEWFDVDWRKKYKTMTDQEWKEAYDKAWRNRNNDCVEETDADRIIEGLGASGTVLEVGAGSGSLAIRLAKAGFGVTAVDVSGEALRQARERSEREGVSILWREGFAEKLPFPDKSFDYVTCCHTLEHVRDLEAATSELKRVARKTIVVLTPRQKFRLYAENYHTQFFEHPEQLTAAFGLRNSDCTEIDCFDHKNEFQGRAFLYIGRIE